MLLERVYSIDALALPLTICSGPTILELEYQLCDDECFSALSNSHPDRPAQSHYGEMPRPRRREFYERVRPA